MQRAEERAAAFLLLGHDSSTVGYSSYLCLPTRFFLGIFPHSDAIFLLNYLLTRAPSLTYIYYGFPANAGDEGERVNGEEHAVEEREDGGNPAHHCHSRTNTEDYADIRYVLEIYC